MKFNVRLGFYIMSAHEASGSLSLSSCVFLLVQRDFLSYEFFLSFWLL